MYLLPYKNGSHGASDLANALGIKQIKREGSKFKGSKDKLVINWGSTIMSDEVAKCEVLNKPEAVALASNKLQFFQCIHRWNSSREYLGNQVKVPTWTTEKRIAMEYLIDDGKTIVARTILNGHSGAGIILCETPEELNEVDAPLYVVYVPKKQEYRIHILNDKVVDIQRKARRTDLPDDQVNWKIRNHDNGFIYSRNEVAKDIPEDALNISINAVNACGLDFGAVDVIYNENQNRSYVLEINTAPGLSGETLAGYTARMKEVMEGFKTGRVKSLKKTLTWVDEVDHFPPIDVMPQNIPNPLWVDFQANQERRNNQQ
jgi:glutathione synthase/RimK-type ligase-like ATP-grasp enzyme